MEWFNKLKDYFSLYKRETMYIDPIEENFNNKQTFYIKDGIVYLDLDFCSKYDDLITRSIYSERFNIRGISLEDFNRIYNENLHMEFINEEMPEELDNYLNDYFYPTEDIEEISDEEIEKYLVDYSYYLDDSNDEYENEYEIEVDKYLEDSNDEVSVNAETYDEEESNKEVFIDVEDSGIKSNDNKFTVYIDFDNRQSFVIMEEPEEIQIPEEDIAAIKARQLWEALVKYNESREIGKQLEEKIKQEEELKQEKLRELNNKLESIIEYIYEDKKKIEKDNRNLELQISLYQAYGKELSKEINGCDLELETISDILETPKKEKVRIKK